MLWVPFDVYFSYNLSDVWIYCLQRFLVLAVLKKKSFNPERVNWVSLSSPIKVQKEYMKEIKL